MANKKKALGKGLGALGLGASKKTTPPTSAETEEKSPKISSPRPPITDTDHAAFISGEIIRELSIDRIRANRYQPRRDFDERSMDELKDSIEQHGILQPVLVRMLPNDAGYELIAGERRFRAAKLAGYTTIPAIIRTMNDAETSEIALIENLQREDLNSIEEAIAYKALVDTFSLTQETLAKRLGRSRTHITNTLRLLQLTESVRDRIIDGSLSMGQARPLVTILNPDLQERAAEYIMDHELSARSAEKLAKKLLDDPHFLHDSAASPVEAQKPPVSVFLTEAEDQLRQFFGTQVRIKQSKKKKTIEIDFIDDDDLTRILESMTQHHRSTLEDKKKALRDFSKNGKLIV